MAWLSKCNLQWLYFHLCKNGLALFGLTLLGSPRHRIISTSICFSLFLIRSNLSSCLLFSPSLTFFLSSFLFLPSSFLLSPSSSKLCAVQVLPSFWVSFVSVFVLQPRHRWRIYQKPQLLGQVKVQFYGWSKIKFMFLLISQKILTNQKNIHNEESAPRSYLLSKKKNFLIEDTFLVL